MSGGHAQKMRRQNPCFTARRLDPGSPEPTGRHRKSLSQSDYLAHGA
jgi:hypothetical protein